jgi:hypothetical protein
MIKCYQEQALMPRFRSKRDHLDVDQESLAIDLEENIVAPNRGVFLERSMDRRAQFDDQWRSSHLQKIQGGAARSMFEVTARCAAELEHLQAVVDDDSVGRVARQNEPIDVSVKF